TRRSSDLECRESNNARILRRGVDSARFRDANDLTSNAFAWLPGGCWSRDTRVQSRRSPSLSRHLLAYVAQERQAILKIQCHQFGQVLDLVFRQRSPLCDTVPVFDSLTTTTPKRR